MKQASEFLARICLIRIKKIKKKAKKKQVLSIEFAYNELLFFCFDLLLLNSSHKARISLTSFTSKFQLKKWKWKI